MNIKAWYENKLVINGDGIVLTPICEADIDDVFENFTNVVTTYMYPSTPKQKTETEAYVKHAINGWITENEMTFIIRSPLGEFIGCAGIHDISTGHPELGIWTKHAAHGHGYGKQAITLLVNFGWENLSIDYFVYPVDHRNGASKRIPLALHGQCQKTYAYVNGNGKTLEIEEYWIYR